MVTSRAIIADKSVAPIGAFHIFPKLVGPSVNVPFSTHTNFQLDLLFFELKGSEKASIGCRTRGYLPRTRRV